MPEIVHRHPRTGTTVLHTRSRLKWGDGTVTISTDRRLPMPPVPDCHGSWGFGTGWEDVELGPRTVGTPSGCARCPITEDCRTASDLQGQTTIRANWELGAHTRKTTMGDTP